jgi:Spy/CpxP family protein refolding chaperone
MKTKTFFIIALAALLTGGFAVGDAVTDAVAQSTAEVVPPDQPTTPDTPTITCPECGNEWPRAHRGHGKTARMHAPHASRGGGFGMSDRLPADRMLRGASGLDLTDEQTAQLEKLSYDAKLKLIDLNSSLEKARLEMKKEMESGNDNLSALKKNLESMSKIKVDIQELKLGNWFEAKKVLTDEQKAKVKDRHPGFGSNI